MSQDLNSLIRLVGTLVGWTLVPEDQESDFPVVVCREFPHLVFDFSEVDHPDPNREIYLVYLTCWVTRAAENYNRQRSRTKRKAWRGLRSALGKLLRNVATRVGPRSRCVFEREDGSWYYADTGEPYEPPEYNYWGMKRVRGADGKYSYSYSDVDGASDRNE